jgi:predicted DNA-binding transcriptional regulator YafY
VSSSKRNKEGLRNWRKQPHHSLPADGDSAQALSHAAANGDRVFICYNGGSTPGATRWIHPRELYGVRGYGGYVRAYCEKRQEERTFSVDKITVLSVERERVSSRTTPSSSRIAAPSTAAARASVPVWVWIVVIIVVLWILSKL